MKVTDPTGTTWHVSRRWLPWRRRARLDDWPASSISALDGGDGGGLGLILLVVALVVILPVVLLAVLVAAELLLLLALLPFVVLGRVLLGHDWQVEVRRRRTAWYDEPAGDWRSSHERIYALSAAIERGDLPVRSVPER